MYELFISEIDQEAMGNGTDLSLGKRPEWLQTKVFYESTLWGCVVHHAAVWSASNIFEKWADVSITPLSMPLALTVQPSSNNLPYSATIPRDCKGQCCWPVKLCDAEFHDWTLITGSGRPEEEAGQGDYHVAACEDPRLLWGKSLQQNCEIPCTSADVCCSFRYVGL